MTAAGSYELLLMVSVSYTCIVFILLNIILQAQSIVRTVVDLELELELVASITYHRLLVTRTIQ